MNESCANSHRFNWGSLSPNEVGRIVQHVREGEGRNEGKILGIQYVMLIVSKINHLSCFQLLSCVGLQYTCGLEIIVIYLHVGEHEKTCLARCTQVSFLF